MPRIAQSILSAAAAILAARNDNSLGNMPNADLLAFHQAHAERFGATPVKRFSSREVGEARCIDLAEAIQAAASAPKAEPKAEVSNHQLSSAIKNSWADPAVRAARAARHPVKVNGIAYRSVSDAWRQLGIPEFQKHAAIRAKVVEEGSAEFGGFKFALA